MANLGTLAEALNAAAECAVALGREKDAVKAYKHALAIHLEMHGDEHLEVAVTYKNIGSVYVSQGKNLEALEMYDKALKIQAKVHGQEHPDVAKTHNSIGVVYNHQGKYDDALAAYKKSLDISIKVHGPEHRDVASTQDNMGIVFMNQEEYPKALEFHGKALKIREKVLGPEHPDVADTYGNIANVYDDQGQYREALEMYQKCLAIETKVYGPEHPDVAKTQECIAIVHWRQGWLDEAMELYGKVLPIKEKTLGPEHPDVASTQYDMGVVFMKQGKYPEALELYNKALKTREKVLGPEHPDVADTIYNKALTSADHKLSAECFERYAGIYKKLHGADNGTTIDAEGRAARAYASAAKVHEENGNYPGAVRMYQKSQDLQLKIHGPKSPDVARTQEKLAFVKERAIAKEFETNCADFRGEITSVAWSQDGRLAFNAPERHITIWHQAKNEICTLRGHAKDNLQCICKFREGDNHRGWSPELVEMNDKCPVTGHSNQVSSVAWSKNGRLASGSGDDSVKIWDPVTGECTCTLRGHSDGVTSVAWSQDGHLASGSYDSIKIWDPETGECTCTLTDTSDDLHAVWTLDWSPDSKVLASGSDNHTAKIWEENSGQRTLGGLDERCVAWSPDGKILASGSCDECRVSLWDLETMTEICTMGGHTGKAPCICYRGYFYKPNRNCPVFGHSAYVFALGWMPDSRHVVTAYHDGIFTVRDPKARNVICTISTGFDSRLKSKNFYHASVSPDGAHIACVGDDSVEIFSSRTAQIVAMLKRLRIAINYRSHDQFRKDRAVPVPRCSGDLWFWISVVGYSELSDDVTSFVLTKLIVLGWQEPNGTD